MSDFAKNQVEFFKVDKALGIAFGFAIVSKIQGKDYYDVQNDHIPESAMLEAASDFMLNSRVGKTMHGGEQTGDVVFAFPLTTDIAKSLGIQTEKTGLIIGFRPSEEETLENLVKGEFGGFSISGIRITDEEIEDEDEDDEADDA